MKNGLALQLSLALCVACATGCASDLHESAGPLVRFPNLTGYVVRDGEPAVDVKVKLETLDGTEVDTDRTNTAGLFEFFEVGAGAWRVEADSRASGDFARVHLDLVMPSADSLVVIPDLDVSLRGFQVESPSDSSVQDVPSFFEPIEFEWGDFAGEKQVRLFQSAEDGGEAVWYSAKTDLTVLRWNGLGTEGAFAGRPVTAGQYRWRVHVEGTESIEYRTGYRALTLED